MVSQNGQNEYFNITTGITTSLNFAITHAPVHFVKYIAKSLHGAFHDQTTKLPQSKTTQAGSDHNSHEVNWTLMIPTIAVCIFLLGVMLCLWWHSRRNKNRAENPTQPAGGTHPPPAHIVLPLTRQNLALTQYARNLNTEWYLSNTSLTVPLSLYDNNAITKTAAVVETRVNLNQGPVDNAQSDGTYKYGPLTGYNNEAYEATILELLVKDDDPTISSEKHVTGQSHSPIKDGGPVDASSALSSSREVNVSAPDSFQVSSSDTNNNGSGSGSGSVPKNNIDENNNCPWGFKAPMITPQDLYKLTWVSQGSSVLLSNHGSVSLSQPNVTISANPDDPFRPPNNTPVTTNTSGPSSVDSRIMNYTISTPFHPAYNTPETGSLCDPNDTPPPYTAAPPSSEITPQTTLPTSSILTIGSTTTTTPYPETTSTNASSHWPISDTVSPSTAEVSMALPISSATQKASWTYNQLYGQFSLHEAAARSFCVSAPILFNVDSNSNSIIVANNDQNFVSTNTSTNTSMCPLVGSAVASEQNPSGFNSHNTSMCPNVGSRESSMINSNSSSLLALTTGTGSTGQGQSGMAGTVTINCNSTNVSIPSDFTGGARAGAVPVVVYHPSTVWTQPILTKTKYWV